MNQALPRTERVRRRPDFERAYDTGVKVHGRFMTVFIAPNGGGHARVGVAATRKLGSAVERNRAKRRSRELFRRHKVAAGLDIVIVPRRDLLAIMGFGALGFGVYQILWTTGLTTVPAGDSALIIAATPVLVALLAVVARTDVLTPAKLAGVLLSFAGVGILVYLTIVKALGHAIGGRPLLILGVLLVVVGIQIFSLGLITELITSHHEERDADRIAPDAHIDEILR